MTIVFVDLISGITTLGRIKFELFPDVPKTAENFRQFCTGEYKEGGRSVGYKGSKMHYLSKSSIVQGGDFIKHNGGGFKSIYGSETFDDESFKYNHEKYSLSMANKGPNSNGCQFFICFKKLPHLDGKHVVFGKVIEGFETVDKLQGLKTFQDKPIDDIIISECGQY